jgi:enamine deaminase RidA (YjgF/YER057c/UK114 family)
MLRTLQRTALSRSSLRRHFVHTEARLAELGYTLPAMPKALGVYVPAVSTGKYIHTAGHICFDDPLDVSTIKVGKVGVVYTTEEAAAIAESIGLELLATLKHEVGDLDKIKRIVKVVGFVNCPDDYGQQPEVLNGCSNLLAAVFQERGIHARSAVGTNSLPRQVPVEIELIAEVE